MTDAISTQSIQERDYIDSLRTMRGILFGLAFATPMCIGVGVGVFLLTR